jgi:hypothetical protein
MARGDDFSQNDAEDILRRAVAIDTLQAHNKDVMLKTAEELGISREAVEQAEREHFLQKREKQEFAEFVRHQRQSFWSHLASYLIVNAFLFGIDVVSDGRLEWAIYPLLGWGIGLAFHAVGVFATKGEDFQKEFEEWRAARNRATHSSD